MRRLKNGARSTGGPPPPPPLPPSAKSKNSEPSRKKSRFSGKNSEKRVRFVCR
jgi:hypothetical protein